MNQPDQGILDRLGRPFKVGVPANLEHPNRAERRAMAGNLRVVKRAAARERDRRASRTRQQRRPGHPGARRGIATPAGPIGPWISQRLHNLEL